MRVSCENWGLSWQRINHSRRADEHVSTSNAELRKTFASEAPNVEFGAGMAERELDAGAVEIKLAGDE